MQTQTSVLPSGPLAFPGFGTPAASPADSPGSQSANPDAPLSDSGSDSGSADTDSASEGETARSEPEPEPEPAAEQATGVMSTPGRGRAAAAKALRRVATPASALARRVGR
eukprot:COSAG04_NODE_1694_length_5910_cov_9.245913_2_plen_111_part_00